eukprot:13888189-Ditylum_brightwellii.AAC.1
MVPGLAYFQDLDTKEKVNANPATTGPNAVPQTEEALHITILLPPWLTKEIKEAEVTSFLVLFLLICKKAHDQDSLADTEQVGENITPSTINRAD